MFVLNIFENGVNGIKLKYPRNATNNIKKIIFLNNIVADKSQKKNDRLNYLKKINRIGLTFYFVTEKDIENIDKKKWYKLYNTLNDKNKKLLIKIAKLSQYGSLKKNKTKKKYKQTKKYGKTNKKSITSKKYGKTNKK
jgi:hypothetical protein